MRPGQLSFIILSLEEVVLHQRSCVLGEMLLRLILHTLEHVETKGRNNEKAI